MAMLPIRTTIKDIARESGVNISTVSRALNGVYGVHPETREHVLQIADRLHYRPNRVARGLVTGRSHSVALVVSDIRNPYFAEVARGAEDAARAAGSDLVLCNSDLNADKQMEYVQSLTEKQVDGILMNSVAELNPKQQDQLLNCGVPIVLLNRSGVKQTFSTVSADNEAGGAIAAEYLLRLGHRNIAHITGPKRHGNMTDRAKGFLRVVRAGRPAKKVVLIHGMNSFDGGYDMTRALLAEHPDVTAIFTANDVMAFGSIRACLDVGRRVPEDISLIGFDNVQMSSIVHPPLTTIHQPKYEIGQAAVETLLRHIRSAGKPVAEHLLLSVELIERQSCRSLL